MATIKDVAALAGVSFTTVSHVINNTRPVNAETRKRVEEAIRATRYVPSAVARSLKHRTTRTIGVLVPTATNPYFAELARGIEDVCAAAGYSVILCNSDDDPRKQRDYLRVLMEKRIDGLIVSSAGPDTALIDALSESALPVVMVDRPTEGILADQVQIDHEEGAYLATRHLVELGHRRIACISGPSTLSVTAGRLAGFHRALREAGVPEQSTGVSEGDFTSPGGYRAARELLTTGERPTAIFASNDLMGIGALRAAAELGISVPRELSIIGFDDIELSRYVYPALSTVGQSIRQLGETTASTLLEHLTDNAARHHQPVPEAPRRIVLPPRLSLRESTAEPARPARAA
ncbi:LacI family transcriptional regulator [Ralstonia solanacearum]|uniref:LacI family DNA-binding transcriptional regulator n=1 Tax=Ralstonia solanacearum TaxID=305 RepID=UPI0005C5442F|nr:LacI family DNA-binding transcriptional regulator [Ralstonia solanacearum]MBB6591614.1 LacI family DNA-binding transcriptional regulator [Ralstonia solanacearum]MBB6595837.1 LacI family DNA-binding transcriptional regulator [Ralstonia solanacearum]MDB0540634.1 LacI family transcriptional regulator [Ralstonia solanacearum]MDB0551004.1 LacI family transcriptional regulator [Ralstonia solanacearum]MDB0555579.1 LacI family transcriptional regulator [Ralstonia solanacearum]